MVDGVIDDGSYEAALVEYPASAWLGMDRHAMLYIPAPQASQGYSASLDKSVRGAGLRSAGCPTGSSTNSPSPRHGLPLPRRFITLHRSCAVLGVQSLAGPQW